MQSAQITEHARADLRVSFRHGASGDAQAQLERETPMVRFMPCIAGLLAFGLATSSQAQVSLDVSKISCDQFVGYKITNPRNIALWLSGYYNGQRGNTMLDTQALTKSAKKLQDYCIRNPQTLVMQAVETVLRE